MTAAELRLKSAVAGIPCQSFIGAANYAQPTLKWLTGAFYEYFREQLFDFGLSRWAVRFECRDFASAFRTYAVVAHAATNAGNAASDGLAVGELWYHPGANPAKAHAINCAFVDDSIVFLEPQSGQCVTLTSDELASAYYLRW